MSLESLRIPAVVVELVNVDTNVVVARSTSDGVGQVTFPDVPAGRYVVRAKRDGFADVTSPPFTVHPGGTEQVLVEMHLVFIRESVSVVAPANSPTQSVNSATASSLPMTMRKARIIARRVGAAVIVVLTCCHGSYLAPLLVSKTNDGRGL